MRNVKIRFGLKPGINHVFIPVYVNGKGPYDFTLDTGAQKTTISSALVDELGLETREVIGEKYEHLKEKRNLKQVEVGSEGIDAIIVCGGTGISPKDVTIEAVRPLLIKTLRTSC